MTVVVDVLQELPAVEDTSLGAQGCCWYTTNGIVCGAVSYLLVTTCHSCTNTG